MNMAEQSDDTRMGGYALQSEDLVRYAANEERLSAKGGAIFFAAVFLFGLFLFAAGLELSKTSSLSKQDDAWLLYFGGAVAAFLGVIGCMACLRATKKLRQILEQRRA